MLSLIFCLPVLGQISLTAGCYTRLRPNEAMVLDTGTYLFTGLDMRDLGKGVWLDGRKARKIDLLYCTFEGKDDGTAVLSSGDLTVSHCTFAQMKEGILQASPPGSKREVTITNNLFRDNLVSVRLEVEKEGMSRIVNPTISVRHYKCRTAGHVWENGFWSLETGMESKATANRSLELTSNIFNNVQTGISLDGSGTVGLELRCNKFETDDNANRMGLSIGGDVGISQAKIGGNGGGQGFGNPNANVWPKKPNTTPLASPDNWISIQKPDEGGLLNYYNYTNEFVASEGHLEPWSGLNRVSMLPFKVAKSPKAVREYCQGLYPGGGTGYNACLANPENESNWLTSVWVAVCENLDDQTEYFPRPGGGGGRLAVANELPSTDRIYLGDPVPNPTKEVATIDLNWPKEKGELVIFELGSGKVVLRQFVYKGRQQTTVCVKDLSAGVYGYRLEGECPCPEPKRLIVIH